MGFEEVFRFTQETSKESGLEPFEAIKLCKILSNLGLPVKCKVLEIEQEKWIADLCGRWNIPGMSVSIVDDIKGEQVFSYGKANPQGALFDEEVCGTQELACL
jgi:hypothetical protein